MRFCIELEFDQNEIPLDYRKYFMSFLKNAFLKYDMEWFNELYHENDPRIKNFTFAIHLNKPEFGRTAILLSDLKVMLNFSTGDPTIGIHFYNSLLKQLYKPYPFGAANNIVLKNIRLLKDAVIRSDTVAVSTLSPVVIRQHDRETNLDRYYSFEDEGFKDALKANILASAEGFIGEDIEADINDIEFIPRKVKSVRVLHYGNKIIGNIGSFIIRGKPYLLEFLLLNGCGSRRSQGFGMLQLEEVR